MSGYARAAIEPIDRFNDVLPAARAGAEWAWARIYAALAPSVAGYLRANGAAEPDDLVGEVFLQVVRGLPRFEGGERDFRAWVLTIAHRRLVDDLRRRGRRPVSPAPDDVVERAAGAGGDVRDEAVAAIEEGAVRAAIDGLPDDQRAVLLLRILGDLTIEEIARALGKRPGAVKALQRRALKRMRGAYPFAGPQR
jgi:RNA polymerase sigma-70 factor (ECF subfamily)